jgi:lipopolysaccharide biosynthesis protein
MEREEKSEDYFLNYPDARLTNLSALRHYEKYGKRLGYSSLDLLVSDIDKSSSLSNQAINNTTDTVFCVHVFYFDLIDEIADWLTQAKSEIQADVVLTLPIEWKLESILYAIQKIAPVHLLLTTNVGRDIWPFLQILGELRTRNYTYGCKIHSKKSTHLPNGKLWRTSLYQALLSPNAIRIVRSLFHGDLNIGLLGPVGTRATCKTPQVVTQNKKSMKLIGDREHVDAQKASDFIAGSMFWFRVKAFPPATLINWTASDFEEELGQIDGTLAHGFERMFPLLAANAGFELRFFESSYVNNPY